MCAKKKQYPTDICTKLRLDKNYSNVKNQKKKSNIPRKPPTTITFTRSTEYISTFLVCDTILSPAGVDFESTHHTPDNLLVRRVMWVEKAADRARDRRRRKERPRARHILVLALCGDPLYCLDDDYHKIPSALFSYFLIVCASINTLKSRLMTCLSCYPAPLHHISVPTPPFYV